MIIQVCGTNGSGKSTVVRKVMAEGEKAGTLLIEGKEFGTTHRLPWVNGLTLVMGRYGEASTGGCDCLKDVKAVRPVIADQSSIMGFHVLFEGIRMMNHADGIEFVKKNPMTLVLLRTTLQECLDAIRERQTAVGRIKPVVVHDIEGNLIRARNYAHKLSELGARKILVTREEAPGIILELLGSKMGSRL